MRILPKLVLLAPFFLLLHPVPAFATDASASAAPRFAVPILCTEAQSAARTKARGTAVVVDLSGIILTAAHVVSQSQLFCTLTALVPNDEWTRASGFRPFSVEQCVTNELLDIALCRIKPRGNNRDWSYLRAASIRMQIPPPASSVVITGFTGWGYFPTVVHGRIASPQQLYRRQDGCYCDFAVDTLTYEGMSGSPLVTEQGDVIGLITTAGTGKFRGISFGTSFERAAAFLRKAGLTSASLAPKK